MPFGVSVLLSESPDFLFFISIFHFPFSNIFENISLRFSLPIIPYWKRFRCFIVEIGIPYYHDHCLTCPVCSSCNHLDDHFLGIRCFVVKAD